MREFTKFGDFIDRPKSEVEAFLRTQNFNDLSAYKKLAELEYIRAEKMKNDLLELLKDPKQKEEIKVKYQQCITQLYVVLMKIEEVATLIVNVREEYLGKEPNPLN